jgi:N-acetylneuraminate synthase
LSRFVDPVEIRGREIGPGHPCLIIAEAGVNHDGDVDKARRLIDAAKQAGSDVVKFQAFRTEELVTSASEKALYQQETTGSGGRQSDMLRALELTATEHHELKQYCDEVGIMYLCTPYDQGSVDMLDEMDVPAFKIASTDSTNIPLLRYMASKGRPVILSSGMTTMSELDAAVEALQNFGCREKIILLHCTSAYPAPRDQSNLRVLSTFLDHYNIPVGFSDHTQGVDVSVLAVAAGASVIEKHLTLDKAAVGPDHRASLEPDELGRLVAGIRDAEGILGDGVKTISPAESANKKVMQKGLVARHRIEAGAVVTEADLTSKRPALGLPPAAIEWVAGCRAKVEIHPDEPITGDLLYRPGEDE